MSGTTAPAQQRWHKRFRLIHIAIPLLLLLIVCFGGDAGITYDEQRQRTYGDQILAWYRSGFHDTSALHFHNLYLYGGLFDSLAQWLSEHSPLGVFETRHYLTACVAALALVPTWRMATIFGGRRAGMLACCVLCVTPLWVGHGLFNPKDIPFGTAAAFALCSCLRVLLGSYGLSRLGAWRAGIPLGIALGIRPGALFLPCYFAFAAIGQRVVVQPPQARASTFKRALIEGAPGIIAGAVVAWLIMLVAWPWAQVSPIVRPIKAVLAAAHFRYRGVVLFQGDIIRASAVPPRYLLVWFAVALPEVYGLALLAGLYALQARLRPMSTQLKLAAALLGSSIIGPIAAAIVMRSAVYDAQRHMLFIVPPLAAVAGIALSSCLSVLRERAPKLRSALVLVIASSLSVAALDIARLHPYEYVYFNRLSGGLSAAVGRFETDYWGASYREGLEWLVTHVTSPARIKKLSVGWCTDWIPLQYYRSYWRQAANFQLSGHATAVDYYLASTRITCKPPAGVVVHTVSRNNVPLLYVLRVQQPQLSGYSAH